MDSLLRYILVKITIKVLLIELAIMLLACISIIIIKLCSHHRTRQSKSAQDKLSIIIESALFSKEPLDKFHIPKDLRNFKNVVEVLEKYNQRFTDDRWVEIRKKTVDECLANSLDKYINSRSWFKRQLAARALLLNPDRASEKDLRKLLNDSRYLVRVVAAVCITNGHYHELFNEMILRMSKETLLSQFPYRDALIQADKEKFEWLELLLTTSQDPAISAICLDILSTRYSDNLLPLIKKFLRVESRPCRIQAIKALGNSPSSEAIDLLIDHLWDSDWEMRSESVLGLRKLYATKAIPTLATMLNDPIWWVRLQAALALKDFGVTGKTILENQDKAVAPIAYEIAQYTLALPA